MTKVNFPNAPHTTFITIDVRSCEHKNTGEMVPATKNKPLIWKKRFENLEEAKKWEVELVQEIKKSLNIIVPERSENES